MPAASQRTRTIGRWTGTLRYCATWTAITGEKEKGRALVRAGLAVPEGIALNDRQVARLLNGDAEATAALAEWLRQRPAGVAGPIVCA